MPRIEPFPDDSAVPVRARALLYFAEREGGPDPRMVRIQGRSEIGLTLLEAWRSVLFGGILDHRLKELIRIRMSALEECGYCSSIRTRRGGDEGVTDEVLLDLADYESSPLFTGREKAALAFADAFKAGRLGSFDGDRLSALFTEAEIVELGILCAFMRQGRFAKSLDVVSWDQACAINPALAAARTS